MIIGIDIRVLGNETKSGIEEYTENLLSHLLPIDSNVKFKLFFSSYRQKLKDYDWLNLPNVELKKYNFPNRFLFASSRFFDWPEIDRLIGGVDVFFSPHFFLTSLTSVCKRVTAIHDLSFIRFPEYFSWRKNFWHKFEMMPDWQSRLSDKIIAVSKATKNDLIEKYNIDSENIKVIYSGISFHMKRPPEEELKLFKIKNSLPDNFILFLGKLEPRKNVIGLIKAFNILSKSGEFKNLHLIIAGAKGWLYKDILKEAEDSLFKDKIIFTGYVKDEERPFYYSLASVFVYPSFFEGFGFPPLEAMACGTPVIASNNSSLPEVVGKSAVLVDPRNLSDIAAAIKEVLTNPRLRSKLVKSGLDRANLFNWHKTAKETLECLLSA